MEEHFQNKPRNFPFEVNFDVYYFETVFCDLFETQNIWQKKKHEISLLDKPNFPLQNCAEFGDEHFFVFTFFKLILLSQIRVFNQCFGFDKNEKKALKSHVQIDILA